MVAGTQKKYYLKTQVCQYPWECQLIKTVSKIATGEAKPNGEIYVSKENTKPFLFPLSISKIPMIGDKTYQILRSMGISTIEMLSNIPMEMLGRVLGKNGIIIWKKSNGIDPTPVEPFHERQSIGTETTFENDSIDIYKIRGMLTAMVSELTYELRKKQKLTSCVTVKIRYSNFDTHTIQKHIPYTSFDHKLIEITRALFDKLYQRRMLIRLVGIRFSDLVYGTEQLNLFEDTVEMSNLYAEMDYIRNRFGLHSVKIASALKESDFSKQKNKSSETENNLPPVFKKRREFNNFH